MCKQKFSGLKKFSVYFPLSFDHTSLAAESVGAICETMKCNGVLPFASGMVTSAPFSMMNFTIGSVAGL
jgi:hypothetical protein